MMTRTQISLDPDAYRELKAEAKRQGISAAEFLRRAVAQALGPPERRRQPWMRYAGALSSGDPDVQATSKYIVSIGKQAGRDERSRRRRARVGGATPAVARQYTVRNVPEHVDRALRRKAGQERKSLNEILRDALIREAGVAEPATRLYTDLDTLAGTWVDDPGFDEVLRAQDQIDESLWR